MKSRLFELVCHRAAGRSGHCSNAELPACVLPESVDLCRGRFENDPMGYILPHADGRRDSGISRQAGKLINEHERREAAKLAAALETSLEGLQ